MASKSSPASKNHHFVPQFILRKISDYVKPRPEDYPGGKEWERAVKKAKNRARFNALDFNNGFENSCLEHPKCNSSFAVQNMYNTSVEEQLSLLEQKASKIIERIEEDFIQGMRTTTIARPDKNVLRRFLFIMLYRNYNFYERFRGGEEDYKANDRAELLKYMHSRGLATPKDVWLSNIRAFLEVNLALDDKMWSAWLMSHAYPGDARWFIKNLTTSYLCFCTASEADDEFILTQNAYGVFEGPSSHIGWTDWHTFVPINEKLIIVMRSGLLGCPPGLPPDLAGAISTAQRKLVDVQTLIYEDPASAHSCLEDLPVTRPIPSYPTLRNASDGVKPQWTQENTFAFEFFPLPHIHVQLINSVFLEEAIKTTVIAYKSPRGLRQALESYLELELPKFKQTVAEPEDNNGETIMYADHDGIREEGNPPENRRHSYLKMIERVARELGSTSTAKLTYVTPRTVLIIPSFPQSVSDRYKILGKQTLHCGSRR